METVKPIRPEVWEALSKVRIAIARQSTKGAKVTIQGEVLELAISPLTDPDGVWNLMSAGQDYHAVVNFFGDVLRAAGLKERA